MMDGDLTASSEKNWLVKSSTRILGPYTLDEVAQNLRLKSISIIDEIRSTSGRWSYIRENQMLLEVIRNIRDDEDPHSEKTMTQSLAQHTQTQSLNQTQTQTKTDALLADDFTPAPFGNVKPKPVEGPKLLDISASESVVAPSKLGSRTRTYGISGDTRLEQQLAKRSRLFQIIITGAALILALIVAFDLLRRSQEKDSSYDELRTAAIRYKSLGIYSRSLQAFQKAQHLKEPDSEFKAFMAPVLIAEDRQTLQGRRILEKVLGQEALGRSDILDAYLGIAASYMIESDWSRAEQALQKALGYDPANFSAKMNMAIIYLRKSSWYEASRAFDELYRRNNKSSLALYGRAVAELEWARLSQQYSHLNRLQRDVEEHQQRSSYLRQELTLLRAYAFKLLGDVNAMNQAVVQFLSLVPGEARDYSRSLYVDWRISRWEYLDKFCHWLYPEQSPHAEFKSLRSVCLMETNRDAEAGQLLKESLAEAPQDPYVLQTQAAFLMKMSKAPEALTILKRPELVSLAGRHLIWGQYCLAQKDLACVYTNFSKAMQLDSRNPMAYYGLAWVAASKMDRARAFDLIRTGLELEPQFLPLLELRDSLEAR